MNTIAAAIMVGSAGMCLGGAPHARRLVGFTAGTVMLCSMADLAYFGLLPPVLWAVLLIIAAILLGLDLRAGSADNQQKAPAEVRQRLGALSESVLHRAVMVASALAYPAAAWLALTHNRSGSRPSNGMTASAAGHVHVSGVSLSSVPSIAIALLILTIATLGVLALLRRRTVLVVESSGMAMTLAVILF